MPISLMPESPDKWQGPAKYSSNPPLSKLLICPLEKEANSSNSPCPSSVEMFTCVLGLAYGSNRGCFADVVISGGSWTLLASSPSAPHSMASSAEMSLARASLLLLEV